MPKKIKQLFDTNLEIAALAIFGVIVLESIALFRGVDGTMFGAAMVCLGAILGWVYKGYYSRKTR